ncbi:MAG: MFS transporter [Peptostreptococcaceae bacterium]|nr:MFS transporter [Peptostreptococcaceae bacterium]
MSQTASTSGKIEKKTLIIILVLGFCWTMNYALAEIQYVLYDPMIDALGISNAQLGFLMTIFGLGNIFGAPIGGWLSDKFNYKKIYVYSLLMTGVISFVFAFKMTYSVALVSWAFLAVSGLLMNYPAHIKILRMLVDEENQGKIFGFNEGAVGVASIVVNWIFIAIFSKFTAAVAGLKVVVIVMGIFAILAALLSFIFVPNPDSEEVKEMQKKIDQKEGFEESADHDKLSLKDFFQVIKSPATWMVGIGLFTVYSLYVTMSYFTPYFSAVFGISATATGSLAIIRTYVLRVCGAPIGGIISDKMKSVSKVMFMTYIISIVVLLGFIFLPKETPLIVIVLMTLVVALFVYMSRGVYYAVASEVHIPRKVAATTIGVAAILGFSPDLFQYMLFGHWLDTHGVAGYKFMFVFQIIVLLIGMIPCGYIIRKNKSKSHNSLE